MFNSRTKLEVSTITCNEDMKGKANCTTVAQLSLTNPRDALHHSKRQNLKNSHVTITTPLLLLMSSCCWHWYSLPVYKIWRL